MVGGPSFPPQNPGLKPGAWGWNLEPGVETWRFVKKPLENTWVKHEMLDLT